MTLFRQTMMLGLLLCSLPMVAVFASSAVAKFLGCTLNEGGASLCLAGGVDIGGTLTFLFVLGWIGMLTLPVGAGLLAIWVIGEIVNLFRRKA